MFTDMELALKKIYDETPDKKDIKTAPFMTDSNPEQIDAFLKGVEKFSKDVIRPNAIKRAEEGVKKEDKNIILPHDMEKIYSQIKSIQLTNIIIPKDKFGFNENEYAGGAGLSYAVHCNCVEKVSAEEASIGTSLAINGSCIDAIDKHATLEAKRICFPKLASESWGGIALTENKPGSDLKLIKTKAVLENGEYVVNGQKRFISDGGKAKYYVLLARTDEIKDAPRNKREFSAFILDRDSPGFEVGEVENKFGLTTSPTTSIYLEDCKISEEYRLGKEGEGLDIVKNTLAGGRIAIAAQSVGIAVGAYREAVKEANREDWKPFNKKIKEFPSTKNRFDLIENYIAKSRWLYLEAANRKQLGYSDWPAWGSKAKLFATELGHKACREASRTFGGSALSKEYAIGWKVLDSWAPTIYEGTSDINQLIIKSHEKKIINHKD